MEKDKDSEIDRKEKSSEKEEIDSLFTVEENEEKVEVEDVVSEQEEKISVNYEPEDLKQLVEFVKNMTTLYDLQPEDWTFANENVISNFFLDVTEPIMMIYFVGNDLNVVLGIPNADESFMDATYFYREPNQIFTVENFHDNINFGTLDHNIEGTLLAVMENVFAPVFLNSTHWPDSVRNDFGNNLHMFLAKLTDIHNKLFGLTVLYIPQECMDIPIDVAVNDKELIKRLEGIVVYWTKQVRVGLQDQDQSTPEDLLAPIEELQFWKYRFKNLRGLNYQLENKGLKKVCDILTAVHSTYVRQFLILINDIRENVEEAKSNIEFLQVLREPCMLMNEAEDPSKIPEHIPDILHLVRFIWLRSPYYNAKDKITLLCRSVSNQIIIQCTDYIKLGVVFEEKATRKAIDMFQTCIDCLTQYIKSYVLISESHTMFGPIPWDLKTAPIFNHVDSLIQRCKDMIEVCECMITFGRYDETEVISKPIFGGSRGPEFESWVDKIEEMFRKSLIEVEKKRSIIFNVQVASWYDEILKFRGKMKDIEVVMENLTNSVFDEVANVEEGIENLAAMYNYSKRRTLSTLFEGKTLMVYKMFRQEIQDIKQDLIDEAEYHPARLPYFAGRAMMARMKKNRLIGLKQLFDDAKWMMPCSLSSEIFSQYEKLITSIDDRTLNLFRRWLDSVGEGLSERLNRPLMVKSATRLGLLECNIDRAMLKVFQEVKYWQTLDYDIPTYVSIVCHKATTIRNVYESVLAVVNDYNKILSSLSDEERLLFKPIINAVEKKISPGLSKLTWATDVGDEYIEECSNTTAELQIFVDTYKTCNLKIVSICEKICDTPLINLVTNYAFELHELKREINTYMAKTIEKLTKYYQEIIEYLIVVFEGFENYMPLMANQWIRYINNFDKLVEKALRVCCKNSLESMYEAVHGDDITGPNPLLKLVVTLKANTISFEPGLTEVAKVISNILPNMVQNLRSIPRLNDKFHVAETEFTPFYRMIEEDKECCKLQEFLNEEVIINAENINEYMKIWEPFRDLWEIDKDRFILKYESKHPNASSFDANMGRYTEFVNNVQMQETVIPVHFSLINSDLLKQAIIEHCIQWQEKLAELLLNLTVKKIQHVHDYVNKYTAAIMKEPESLKEMQNALVLLKKLKQDVPEEESEFPTIREHMEVLAKYRVEMSDNMRNLERRISAVWSEYLETLEEAEKMLGYAQETFKNTLLENSQSLRTEANELIEEFTHIGPFAADINPKDALAYIKSLKENIAALREKEDQLRKELAIFGLSLPDCEELTALEKELATLELVWQLADEWETSWQSYREGVFWDIDTEEMEEKTQTLFRKLNRLARELKEKNWDIVESTRSKVDAFRRTLPLISDLKNPAMRPRHWDRVRNVMNRDFDENSPEFNMDAIFAMEFHLFADDINEISNAATMELQIEKGLILIAETWKTMSIEMVPHRDKGIYRIKSVDEAFTTLDDNMLMLSNMKSTRFVEPFQKEVDFWEKTLTYVMETLEIALSVQRQYLYLENIFLGEDIRKQLPKESEDFERLSVDWKDITSNMFEAGTALKATHYRPPPYLFNKLNKMNDKLEIIQRALERYLESKRYIFPRFYFISNDDMLEILGNGKKPEMVQPHLKKLFDNLVKIKIQKNVGTNKFEAVKMYSDDGEEMALTRFVILDGPVELWLLELEKSMRVTLKTEFKPCRAALKKMLNKRDKWLMTYCGQLCNACSQIQWTTDCTRALVHAKIMESKKPLKKLRKKQNRVLSKLSELSRRELLKIQRLKTNALITIEIHCRDVIDRMYKANCRDTNHFEWFSQLRFYWDRDVDDCVIKQTNTSFWYGYEYNGNSGRLVITPLTDRCYITLTTALHLFRGGSPKGPAGTGKTETVKDLGKAMGFWVIVNNCSEGLDYKSMGKCFSGLAQTGAWGCFDEFNRINIEVLSVVAQQILCILTAIAQKQKRVVFEGAEISLKLTCGIFITMNPGYAGRTELPDNLKSMFRPISMMVPDSAIIAENILFSDGFQNTKILAKKVFTLYQLAMKQLSKQDHYDFGLRSMVALLRYAGRKRRLLSHLPEEQVVYLAMRDMNVARFTSDDLPLFNGIMSDIFPGVTIPTVDYMDMNNAIIKYMEMNQLQPIPIALTKVLQLYETKSSRHSVMILGKTCTAKSVTWQTLQGAMSILNEQNKPGYQKVHVHPINPKALNLGELYGEYNLATNEWLDGVISSIMRITCSEESPDEKWILFDGPVDAVWIENMNSVMDDNKVLTLINSDRITMPEQVSLLFEVGDLSVASPATVSRCGMVYNDYKDWGWLPFVTSWVQRHEHLGRKFHDAIMAHFINYVGNILEFKRLNCEETVVCAELNLVKSLCVLLDIFATKENGVDPNKEETFDEYLKLWFLFCLIWSVCCTINEAGRKKMDVFIREKEACFPIKDSIYEYFIDVRSKCFSPWEEKLPYGWRYDPNAPFFKIIVPTVDTVRYEFVLSTLLENGYPVLITGPVGTGKTSSAQTVLQSLSTEKYMVANINMSAQTTSLNLQEFVESRIEKRTKGVFIPIGGKKMITFLDDFNMPAKETYGSQPPLELLRQWIDYGFWYDRQKQSRKYIQNMIVMAGMGPPGGGRNVISDRLLSRFNVINMTFPDDSNILRIFGTMLSQHLAEFDDEVKMTGRDIPETTLDVYNAVSQTMLPTPTKIHYLFNLRDISKIFQGLLRSHKDYQSTKHTFLRLWVHECYRVFNDRLIDDKDQEWFLSQMNEQLGSHYELTVHALCPKNEIPFYTDFVNVYRIYEDLTDLQALKAFLENEMEEYNVSPGVVSLDLVLFRDAIDHICRIERVISQPRGNMLLVGVGGSGRQSLSRISAYLCEYNTFQVNVTRNYGVPEFKEDLKKLYNLTGVDNKATSFLFNDTQVTTESFLEIINNMLSSGEVPNLYKPEEIEEVKNKIYNAAVKAGALPTQEGLLNFLKERARANLHIILCMSPIGSSFRNRLRQYPALINCTTIDWFKEWPKEALLEVAYKYIADVNFVQRITGEEKGDRRRESVIISTQDKLRTGTAEVFSVIHDSVAKKSKQMEDEMKRYNYVTPTNYLELVARYKIMLREKREEIATQANKLRSGVWKIEDCRQKVETMSVELEEAQTKVAEFQVQCDEYLVIIVTQKKEIDEQAKEVAVKSVRIAEEEQVCKRLASVAQADLDEAMPALNEAIAALDALSKKDISELKSYGKPPEKVQMVMEAVNILKGVDTSWAEAKRQLGEMNFLQSLKDFDKNHISEKTLKKIVQYTTNEEFQPDKVGIVSFAAKSLCMWVIAIEKYAKVWKIVGPKQEKLDVAMASLLEKQQLLAEAQAKLAELNAKLAKLQEEYEEKLKQKEDLNRKAELLKLKLERAAMLVENLSGEAQRWSESVVELDAAYELLPGNCLLSTAFISYLGPFVTVYRQQLLQLWINEVTKEEIPCSADYNIISFLCDPTTVREWNMQGLPADSFSTENGIIVTKSSRWPLLIDPQCQAMKWIKAREAANDLKVIDFGMSNFMKIIENAVITGLPVLLQNITETLDPSVNPILGKAIVKQGGMNLIKLDDKMVSYHDDFRFFLTTKLTNPHYAPEISTKTIIVNFAVKEEGLQAQLLGIVVRKEKPQLEEQKDKLVTTIAKGKKTLIDLENELLRLLNESRGSILEDAELFGTLQVSKATSIAVKKSLEVSEHTEIEIDTAREAYSPCAKRASILFFVLNDMGRIDPMYQFALDSYIYLFDKSIDKSEKSPVLPERIVFLNDYHTYAVYKNTCRALFEQHKLLFSFHMCVKILSAEGKIIEAEYNFLLKGGVVLDRENQIDKPGTWMPDDVWDNITELDKIGGFHGVIDTFEQYSRDWFLWYTDTEPENLPLIGEWNEICNEFQKMLFIRSLRLDRVEFCITNFITNQLGPRFVEPPVLDIKAVLEESVPQTPLIFVLSPGVDPTSALTALAESQNMGSRFGTLSLGQGQAPIATKMIQTGLKQGQWIFLANCHLSLSWMPRLDKLVESLQTGKVNSKFRLWLSSSPNPDFPISILQAGIKMTTEPPKGLKANLKRLYNIITEEQFSVCEAREKYKKLLFALCFFHAILLERKKFQQLGWNVIYSFNDSDFEVSENLLTIYLDEYPQTPWDALKYLIAGVNYGGHVTDDWDRRLLTTYINQFFCEDAINVPYYRLSSLSVYYIPRDGSLHSYQDYITLLPNNDRPEAFGQHPNADITSQITESRNLFETLMSLQIRSSSSDDESKEEKVAKLASDVLSKIPKVIDYENTEKLIGTEKKPLDVVLLQEISRYNALLINMKSSLVDLKKGIQGLVVMSAELEEIFTCFFDGRVPSGWLKAYPSLKLLGSWTRDLVSRVEHFSVWAETTHAPLFFWLAAYTFPTGFLTAVLQTTARKTEVPIDTLSWEFTVQTLEEYQIQMAPESGVYVRGLFLEGAGWDKKPACLVEPHPMQLVCPMPLIHFKPVEQLKKKTKGLYQCPVYYYPVRTGSQSQPSFVVAVDLKSGTENSDFWIKRGTALLLSLAN